MTIFTLLAASPAQLPRSARGGISPDLPGVLVDRVMDATMIEWTAVIVVAALLATALGLLLFFRMRLRRRAALFRTGDDAFIVYRITLPKFRNEEDARGNETVQVLRERIAVIESIYASLGGLPPQKGLRTWLHGRHDTFAFEIVAQQKLVTFYAAVPKRFSEFFTQQMTAQYSDAFLEPIPDYNIFSPTGTVVGGYVTLRRASMFPLKTYKELDADPLNAITNSLSKVADGDGLAVQVLMRPAHRGWRSKGLHIVRDMQKGMTLEEALRGGVKSGWFETKDDREKREAKTRERRMSAAETKMLEGIENKLSKAALDVNVRILASSHSPEAAQLYLTNVVQAFGQYSIYEYGNAFEKKIPRSKKAIVEHFVHRMFSDRHHMVLTTEELASVWHLPLPSTETPNINWMLARSAPAPVNIPTQGLHLGYNMFRSKRTEIYMKDADRRRHMYLIGKTGSGKSEFMKHLVIQDIQAGRGVGVIDPHGELAEGVLELIPKERVDDVVYFNPSDVDRPMGLNMLEASDEKERDFMVQEMISIFTMLFPPEFIGPMFEHSMRNYMLTLMADPKHPGTLVEIPRMIADEEFQQLWVSRVKDPLVRSFWEDEMAKTTDYHKSEMMGYLVSKVGRFVENEMMRNIIGQTKSAFDFREIMDKGKILIVNLSKGKTGEVNASLIGLILVAKLQMAAFSRADVPEDQRKDFYLYIDEFQNFVTPSIATILSEARKYRLDLTLAHQYMGQLVKDSKAEIRDAVLGNVGSMFVSRVGPEDVEVLGKVFEPTFSKYDLMNNDMFTWNVKMIVDNAQQPPFTMKTYPPLRGSKKVADALREISRLTYGNPKEEVERDIAARAGTGIKKKLPDPPFTL